VIDQQELKLAAEDFRFWTEQEKISLHLEFKDVVEIENHINSLRNWGEFSDRWISNASAYLGELVIEKFDGEWIDDHLFGYVVENIGDSNNLSFSPSHLIQFFLTSKGKVSLSRILGSLPERIKQSKKIEEKILASWGALDHFFFARLWNEKKALTPSILCKQLQDDFEKAFDRKLVLSLEGVKELERYLRSQFFFCELTEDFLYRAGFFVGEVARQLFQGTWKFDQDTELETSRFVLQYPEISYYPVGRVFKFLVTQPMDEHLDEYIRLIPSARKEMAKLN